MVMSGAKTKSAFQILDVPVDPPWSRGRRPGDDDVFRVAFVEPAPLLIAEDVEVEHVEDLEVALDRGRLALLSGRRGERMLGRGLRERRSGEADRYEAATAACLLNVSMGGSP